MMGWVRLRGGKGGVGACSAKVSDMYKVARWWE